MRLPLCLPVSGDPITSARSDGSLTTDQCGGTEGLVAFRLVAPPFPRILFMIRASHHLVLMCTHLVSHFVLSCLFTTFVRSPLLRSLANACGRSRLARSFLVFVGVSLSFSCFSACPSHTLLCDSCFCATRLHRFITYGLFDPRPISILAYVSTLIDPSMVCLFVFLLSISAHYLSYVLLRSLADSHIHFPLFSCSVSPLFLSFSAGRGTSMACGVAAGGAALIRQYFAQGYFPTGRSEACISTLTLSLFLFSFITYVLCVCVSQLSAIGLSLTLLFVALLHVHDDKHLQMMDGPILVLFIYVLSWLRDIMGVRYNASVVASSVLVKSPCLRARNNNTRPHIASECQHS